MLTKVRVRKHERGLWFRHGDFAGLLLPGERRFWSRLWSPTRDTVEVFNTLETLVRHPLIETLVRDPALQAEAPPVELGDSQRAIVWRDNRLAFLLGPGRYALWKEPFALSVEVFDAGAFRFDHPRLEAILVHPEVVRFFEVVNVEAHETALLYRNGELVERLARGRHVFWKGAGRVNWKLVDLREQTADVAGQEIMTADKVTLRVNLVVTWQVADAVKATSVSADHAQALYREAQLALRAAVGTRALDALLADKESIGAEVRDALARRTGEFGVGVKGVGLRDIVLPGEMKAILNQVITAEKQAQANLIKRREETAAARSQANTARLLAENPTLARFKELEMLQEILAGTKATFVFGDGDLAGRVKALIASGEPA
jgi:regulator of protease activity HflC (stomatin/prohibitin superfamily)